MTVGPARLLRSPSGRTVVLALRGPLDESSLPALEAGLRAAYESVARALVVDVAQVPVCDQASAAALLGAHRDLQRAARDLLVVNVQPWVCHQLRRVDRDAELRLVPYERLLSSLWREPGALRPLAERV